MHATAVDNPTSIADAARALGITRLVALCAAVAGVAAALYYAHLDLTLSHYDAREWAASLGKPAESLVTTRDRLVKPRKQRALADALNAFVIEVPADHLAAWTSPEAFAKATVELVRHVVE